MRSKPVHWSQCLTQHAPDDGGHYICFQSREHLPSRMRVFIDFMTERIRAADLQCATDLTSLSPRKDHAKPDPDQST